MSTELKQLFERTLPREEAILRRMAFARTRREQSQTGLFRDARTWFWVTAGVATCATLIVVLHSRTPVASLQPERFDAKSSRSAAPRLETHSHVAQEPTPAAGSAEAPKVAPRIVTDARGKRTPLVAASAVQHAPATWEAAARAMRSGDQAEAQRVLAELSKSEDPEVRDSALLVRLRSALQARSQRPRLTAKELNQLEALVSSGATASIRTDARKLLQEARSHE